MAMRGAVGGRIRSLQTMTFLGEGRESAWCLWTWRRPVTCARVYPCGSLRAAHRPYRHAHRPDARSRLHEDLHFGLGSLNRESIPNRALRAQRCARAVSRGISSERVARAMAMGLGMAMGLLIAEFESGSAPRPGFPRGTMRANGQPRHRPHCACDGEGPLGWRGAFGMARGLASNRDSESLVLIDRNPNS